MFDQDSQAQAIISPFAVLLTAFLWVETWVEILSLGARHSPDDLSKLYLAIVTAYACSAEVSKWLVNEPTNPRLDPRFERIQRGGVLIGLWLIPLLFAYTWRMSNDKVPMPGPLGKIVIGLVGVFFLKATSRRLRHKQHGVINPLTGEMQGDESSGASARDVAFADSLYARIAASKDGMAVAEKTAAFPDFSRQHLYRALDKLVKAHRLTRTGKPRTPDVRYRASKE